MKYAYLFLFYLLFLAPTLTNEHPLSAEVRITTDTQKPLTDSYLKDLEELGYCIIPQILSTSETELLYQRVWHEFIEKAWPNCKLDDRSNWEKTFPISSRYGIFVGSAGQIQVMWDLRQDPRIVDVFAKIWNTQDLIVSMDGLCIMCPPEIRDGYFNPWPHVDQGSNNPPDFISESSLQTKPFTIQGQFLLEDSFDGDGGFYCIPKSHLKFKEFSPQLEALGAMNISPEEIQKAQTEYLVNFFEQTIDESENCYRMKHITAPRGSLILWDSRTVHWNQYPSKDRFYRDNSKLRMIGYLCYVPKTRLTNEGKEIRKQAFEMNLTTTHNPADLVLRPTKNQQYPEDPSYIHPKINLTILGESLLGF